MKSGQEYLAEAKKIVPEITVEDLRKKLASGTPPVVVDVRERSEYEEGHIPGAVHLSRSFLEFKAAQVLPDPDAEIVCQCGSGMRSLLAAKTLKEMGYAKVSSLAGGFKGWVDSGGPVES